MRVAALAELIRSGKKPVVRLTDPPWEDSWGEKGMIAEVVSVRDSDVDEGLVEFVFDYNRFRADNLLLQSHQYFIYNDGAEKGMGTAFEAGMMDEKDIKEEYVADLKDNINVELVAETRLLAEYVSSGSVIPYAEWLEHRVNALLNEKEALQREKDKLLREIHGSPKPRRQDTWLEQIRVLIPLANREGCCDAADYLKQLVEAGVRRS